VPIETCFIQRRSLSLPPSAARVAGTASHLELSIGEGSLVLRPGETGTPVNDGQVFIPQSILDALGWNPGTVVEVHSAEGQDMRVLKSRDPLSPAYVTHHRGAAVPPGWLMQTVVGSPDPQGFLRTSYGVAKLVVDAATPHIGDRSTWRVLDFGCGCGRLSRALPLYRKVQIVGCDLQEVAIKWCSEWLDGEFFVGKETPPLELPDSHFDVLVAISVLTHLSEEHQNAWLAEWSRLMRPGGILVVTFRGRRYVNEAFPERFDPKRLQPIEAEWARTGGMAHVRSDFWGGVFPEYYGDSFHTEEYVRSHWGTFFQVLDIVPASRHGVITQDTAILCAKGSP
jgi:SAM-dependent methyltransferase